MLYYIHCSHFSLRQCTSFLDCSKSFLYVLLSFSVASLQYTGQARANNIVKTQADHATLQFTMIQCLLTWNQTSISCKLLRRHMLTSLGSSSITLLSAALAFFLFLQTFQDISSLGIACCLCFLKDSSHGLFFVVIWIIAQKFPPLAELPCLPTCISQKHPILLNLPINK